ncbi:MAG: bifunctional UDP-sugar hydrolase/5'-nucleotidase [Cellulosilyticaceae bacterium]
MNKLRRTAIVVMMFVLLAFPAFAGQDATITIFHTNDVHGNVEDNGKDVIGFAKMATYVADYKKEHNNVIVLDGGDMFQGLPFANIEKGHSVVPLANQVGYDAMVPGNHEFDFGADNLLKIKDELKYDMLSANVYKDGKTVFKPYVVKEVAGLKVGIFGITTPETVSTTHPNNIKGYVFKELIPVAQETVKTLRETEKVDLVIMVGHLGVEGDLTSISVAEKVEGIDVIVDGHSHTTLPEGKMVKDTLIVSATTALKNIGQVEINVQDGKVVDKTAKLLAYEDLKAVIPNEAITNKIKETKATQEKELNIVVGKTEKELVGEREVVRTGESNLGQLATAAMMDISDADIALTNGGGIRASIKAGDITKKDVVTVFPFGNTIMVKEMKGSDIVAALEHGVSKYPEANGGFPHTAGITYTLDGTKEPGNRVSDLKVAGEPIVLDKMYSVVTNDFTAAGGDGYVMFKDYPVKHEYNTLMDTLLAYVEKQETLKGEFTQTIKVIEGPIKVRDFAKKNGYAVGFDEKTHMVTLTKEAMVIQFKTGGTEFVVSNGTKDVKGNFKESVKIKNNTNYFDKNQADLLVKTVPAA